jgi:hypothetical protein
MMRPRFHACWGSWLCVGRFMADPLRGMPHPGQLYQKFREGALASRQVRTLGHCREADIDRCRLNGLFQPIVLKKSAPGRLLIEAERIAEGCSPSCRQGRCSGLHQLRHFPEVLGGGCEEELVACAAWSSQAQPAEFEDALQVRKQYLDLCPARVARGRRHRWRRCRAPCRGRLRGWSGGSCEQDLSDRTAALGNKRHSRA